jgi:hypothetical protein
MMEFWRVLSQVGPKNDVAALATLADMAASQLLEQNGVGGFGPKDDKGAKGKMLFCHETHEAHQK